MIRVGVDQQPAGSGGECTHGAFAILDRLEIDGIGAFRAQHQQQEAEDERVQRAAAEIDHRGTLQLGRGHSVQDRHDDVSKPAGREPVQMDVQPRVEQILELTRDDEILVPFVGLAGIEPCHELGRQVDQGQ